MSDDRTMMGLDWYMTGDATADAGFTSGVCSLCRDLLASALTVYFSFIFFQTMYAWGTGEEVSTQ